MSILRLAGIAREIGTLRILDGVDAAIAAGERVGLVGANGSGKTTLLRIAVGMEEPDAGRVERRRGLNMGLLTQEANLDPDLVAGRDLRTFVRSGAAELERLETELATLEAAGPEAVAGPRYAEAQHRFEALGGYALDPRVDETLSGLGLARPAWARDPATLSGGEQTRAALARLVVADPELLLLDEPTNHLDIAALEWLEQALARRRGALVIASHDRAFLDAVVVRIWELRDRRLTVFRGDYSAYAVQRAGRDARARSEAEMQTERMAREQDLIQRYRSHRKYGKMHEHEARLAALQPIAAPRQGPPLRLADRVLSGGAPVRSGDVVVEVRDAVLGIPPGPGLSDGRPLLGAPRLEARRGERIGVVGPNGIGKTTLLRTIAGEIAPLEGVARLGPAVGVGYLAQLREAALAGATVLDALLARVDLPPGEARGYLARFLFRGDDVFKEVAVLSGGERSRLELALLGVLPANLLLLDEPTNHLDIPAREVLEGFLRETAATVLVVSHDRRLLEAVCGRLWILGPTGMPVAGGDGREPGLGGPPAAAVSFDGGFRAWREALAEGWTIAGALASQRGVRPVAAPSARLRPAEPAPVGAASSRRATAARPAALSKDTYRRQRGAIEADLTRLGLRKSQLELALGDPDVQANFVELRRLTSELADVDAALGAAEEGWLTLAERAPR